MTIASVCLGCESPKLQLYPGDVRPSHEVATIREAPQGDIDVITINGTEVRGASFEVLPGTYEVVLEARSRVTLHTPAAVQRLRIKTTCTLSLEARAGEVYVTRSSASFSSEAGGMHWGKLDVWFEPQSKQGSRVGKPECSPDVVVLT